MCWPLSLSSDCTNGIEWRHGGSPVPAQTRGSAEGEGGLKPRLKQGVLLKEGSLPLLWWIFNAEVEMSFPANEQTQAISPQPLPQDHSAV